MKYKKRYYNIKFNVNIKYEKYMKFFKENYMTKRKIKIVQPSLLMDY